MAATMNVQVWTPLIEAQAKVMEEFLEENLKVDVTDAMRKELISLLELPTDDFGSIFKKKAGRKAGRGASASKKATSGKQCCANTYGKGTPTRCTRHCAEDEGEYCLVHSKEIASYGGKPKHGRFDEPTPLTWSKYASGLLIKGPIAHEWKDEELVERLKEAGLKTVARRSRSNSDSSKKAKREKTK
jgi:hypothetical protein